MNAVILGILGLVTGLFSGSLLFNDDSISPRAEEVRVQENSGVEVASADYVSMRPEIMKIEKSDLSAAEREGLLFMREEEKLARDVYITLYETWGNQIFANIAQSEQTHTEAVRQLLEKYSITDPVSDDTVGQFVNPEFSKLYTDLVAKGNTSEVEALKVGALIEDLDIKDLNERISQTDNDDIKRVYENLLRGSRNHLRAFDKQLRNQGATYEPEYISKEEFETVIKAPQEQGTGSGWGGRDGNGRQGGR